MAEHTNMKDENTTLNVNEQLSGDGNKGEVIAKKTDESFNLDSFPYDEKTGLTNEQIKKIARGLARDGVDGKEVRSTTIEKILEQKYPKENIPSQRTISKYIKGVQFGGKEQPFIYSDWRDDPESAPYLSYIMRLNLVKKLINSGRSITQQEALQARRVMLEFDDPRGRKVDLIAQYVLVRELAERKAANKPSRDIEDLLVFAPWQDDGDANRYLMAIQKGMAMPPFLRLITPSISEQSGGRITFKNLYIGAWAQLNLPFFIGFERKLSDDSEPQTTWMLRNCNTKKQLGVDSVKAEDWKHYCDWRKEVDQQV